MLLIVILLKNLIRWWLNSLNRRHQIFLQDLFILLGIHYWYFANTLRLKIFSNHYTTTAKFDIWYSVLSWVAFTIFPSNMFSIIMTKHLNFSFIYHILSQNEFSCCLYCLMNFNLASLRRFIKRGIFFSLRDIRPFLSISLLIIRLVTLHPNNRKSSCISSRVNIGFWFIRRPNFLQIQREILLEHLFFFVFNYVMSFKPYNKWTYRSRINI